MTRHGQHSQYHLIRYRCFSLRCLRRLRPPPLCCLIRLCRFACRLIRCHATAWRHTLMRHHVAALADECAMRASVGVMPYERDRYPAAMLRHAQSANMMTLREHIARYSAILLLLRRRAIAARCALYAQDYEEERDDMLPRCNACVAAIAPRLSDTNDITALSPDAYNDTSSRTNVGHHHDEVIDADTRTRVNGHTAYSVMARYTCDARARYARCAR